MERFKLEVMSIIGVFGLQDLPLKTTKMLLDPLIANLVLSLYRFGKLFINSQKLKIGPIPQLNFFLTKDTILDLIP